MPDYNPHDAADFIYNQAPIYAKACGDLAAVEAYKSSLKAILMKKSGETSLGAQEREAYAHEEYQNLCDAIGSATEQVQLLRWQIKAAEMRFEAWRTEQANNRNFDRMIK